MQTLVQHLPRQLSRQLNGAFWVYPTLYAYSGGTIPTGSQMYFDNFSVSAIAVPESSTYAMFAGLGALGFVFWRRRLITVN